VTSKGWGLECLCMGVCECGGTAVSAGRKVVGWQGLADAVWSAIFHLLPGLLSVCCHHHAVLFHMGLECDACSSNARIKSAASLA
jgi:hypothetical protein